MKRSITSRLLAVASALLLVLGVPAVASACGGNQQSCSGGYGVDEVYFGTGGELNACSTNYCSKQAAGELGVGNSTTGSSASNYQVHAGFNTNRAPYLEFSVTNGTTDLGYLSSSSTKTATGTFKVKTYLAGGYIVQTQGDPPTDNAPGHHQMNTLTSATTPTAGVEQFGMNLVANTSPTSFGADPVQVPDSTFSFGTVASGYNQVNKFKYVKGDTVAQSTRSSGETDYTISYIFNISNATPDGTYTFNDVLVATSTF